MTGRWIFIAALGWAAAAAAGDWPPYVLEWPATTGDVLVAETSKYTLKRYSRSENGDVVVRSEPMSIGQNGAGKRREGDLRTPFGVYFVVDRLDTSPLHPKYGSAAFPLDYPNARDRQQARTGGGIWLHGVLPNTVTPVPRDTDGCIAINNAALNALAVRLKVLSTPVIVTPSSKDGAPENADGLGDALIQSIDRWTASLSAGRLDEFLSHYSAGFSYQGLSLEKFLSLKAGQLADQGIVRVSHRDVFIAAVPADPGVFLSRFMLTEELADGSHRDRWKRLYWKRESSGSFLIIAEDET